MCGPRIRHSRGRRRSSRTTPHEMDPRTSLTFFSRSGDGFNTALWFDYLTLILRFPAGFRPLHFSNCTFIIHSESDLGGLEFLILSRYGFDILLLQNGGRIPKAM